MSRESRDPAARTSRRFMPTSPSQVKEIGVKHISNARCWGKGGIARKICCWQLESPSKRTVDILNGVSREGCWLVEVVRMNAKDGRNTFGLVHICTQARIHGSCTGHQKRHLHDLIGYIGARIRVSLREVQVQVKQSNGLYSRHLNLQAVEPNRDAQVLLSETGRLRGLQSNTSLVYVLSVTGLVLAALVCTVLKHTRPPRGLGQSAQGKLLLYTRRV